MIQELMKYVCPVMASPILQFILSLIAYWSIYMHEKNEAHSEVVLKLENEKIEKNKYITF